MTVHPFPQPETTEAHCWGCGKRTLHDDAGPAPATGKANLRAGRCTECGHVGGANFGLPGQRYGKHGGEW